MIIHKANDITENVLSELEHSEDDRFKEIMRSAVKHLHAFVKETRLSEAEYQKVCQVIAKLGQKTNEFHNEVVLAGGSLGVSALVCLINNGNSSDDEQSQTTANMLGPFWRDGSPLTPNGANLARGATKGDPIFVKAWVKDTSGRPVTGAMVDVWHTSAEGFYENQDPSQVDMNLRGRFMTDEQGLIEFRSVKPAGYPIPVDGPVGELLRMQGRHNMRPAHIHFLINKEGYKTQFSQVYSSDDPHIHSDVQFGVTHALLAHYERHEGPGPQSDIKGVWYTLEHTFVINKGEARLPKAPIQGKNTGELPEQVILKANH
jgi:catechol 1,2-dioxygenase